MDTKQRLRMEKGTVGKKNGRVKASANGKAKPSASKSKGAVKKSCPKKDSSEDIFTEGEQGGKAGEESTL